MSTLPHRVLFAVPICLFAAALPLSAQADTDACTLLTPAQVGAAVGVAVGAGAHVTSTFVRTCTWTPIASSDVKAVTLYVQTAAAYDSGKNLSTQMAAMGRGSAVNASGLGDDAYYFVVRDQVGLLVKKGSLSIKSAVYATLSVDKKEAMERSLAKQALAKL